MKAINKLLGILFISFLATACATTSFKLDKKYTFASELEEATGITDFRIESWQHIDFQSLIVEANINEYYLIILQQPAPMLPSSETIGITVSINRVRPGYDKIVVSDSTGSESYIIQKIYKLKDKEHAKEIKARLKKS